MLGKVIHKYNLLILLVTVLLSLGSLKLFPGLKTDVSFKQFFPEGDHSYETYKTFSGKMGSSENTLVLAITNQRSIFDSIFLGKLQELQAVIDSMKEVQASFSILTIQKYKQLAPGYFYKRPYVQANHPERFKKDSILLFKDFPLTQFFITPNSRCSKILIQLHDSLTFKQADSVVRKIDIAATRLSITPIHLLGRKYMESEFEKLVNKELKTSVELTLLFVALLLFLLHRSFAGVIIPIVCMAVSLIMLYGYMALFNRPLTIMSNLFPTIVLIVGISDVIHISSKFAYESLVQKNSVLAITKTLKEIGLTTFINSFTTAIGFLTLLTMSMKAMQSFGVDAAVGLMIAWLNSVFLLPSLLLRYKLAGSFSRPVESKWWHSLLKKTFVITAAYPKHIMFFFSILVIIAFIGTAFINTNNYVLTSLPGNNRLKNDYSFFDKEMGGGRGFELIINTKNTHKVFDQDIIQNIDKLERYLQSNTGVVQIFSPVLVMKWLGQVAHSGTNWKVPGSKDDYHSLQSLVYSNQIHLPLQVADSSATIGRLYGRIEDKGRKAIEASDQQMMQWINQNIDTSKVQFEITGIDHITDIGHQLRIDNLKSSFLLEILIVSIIIGLIYRSLLMVLITFIANIVPIILIGGVMGFAGIELRGATTAIFAIGYVIAVDDTLHFVNRFQLEKRKGFTTNAALNKTLLYTGRAMVITSLILLGGFAILMHSAFGDVFMHGFLVSLIVLTGLLTELLLTPVLVRYFFPDASKEITPGKQQIIQSNILGS